MAKTCCVNLFHDYTLATPTSILFQDIILTNLNKSLFVNLLFIKLFLKNPLIPINGLERIFYFNEEFPLSSRANKLSDIV